jgi:hypothetical protein
MKGAVSNLIGIVLLSVSAYAGDVTIREMLLASLNDDAIKELDRTTKVNTKGSYGGIPFIDDIELRMRNEAFDIYRMRYTLRIRPRGIGETKAGSQFDRTFSQNFKRKLEFGKNGALRDRYIQILDQMEERALEQNYRELIEVYEDMIKVMEKKQSDVAAFELDKLIDGEDKNTKLHNDIYELKRGFFPSYNGIMNSLHAKELGVFDTTGFVDIDSVIALVERNNFSFDTNNAYLEYYRSRYQLAEARFQLEKAEQRQYISLLAASYDNGEMLDQLEDRDKFKNYDLKYAYHLELGIRIPDLTMARYDLARRKADYLDEKDDYEKAKRELVGRMNKDKEDLLSFIAQYRFLKARETEVDANSSLKKYLQMSGVDPLILLKIKESIVKNHVEMQKLKYRILRNYIQVIDYCGILSKQPLRNYLSKEMEVLQP